MHLIHCRLCCDASQFFQPSPSRNLAHLAKKFIIGRVRLYWLNLPAWRFRDPVREMIAELRTTKVLIAYATHIASRPS